MRDDNARLYYKYGSYVMYRYNSKSFFLLKKKYILNNHLLYDNINNIIIYLFIY